MDPALKTNSLFRPNIFSLRAFCFLYYEGERFEKIVRTMGYCIMMTLGVLNLFEFIYLLKNWDNLFALIFSWSTCLMQIVNIVKINSYLNNHDKFNELLLSMHKEMEYVEQYGEEEAKQILLDFTKTYKKIRALVYAWTTPVVIFFYAYFIVNFYVWGNIQLLPFEMWHPYDEQEYSFLNSLLPGIMCTIAIHAYYTNYPYILLYLFYAIFKLDLLNLRIRNISGVNTGIKINHGDDDDITNDDLNKERYRYACDCVRYHLDCIQFVNKVQYVYRIVLAAELTVFTIILSACILGMALVPFGMIMVVNISFGICFSLILFAIYWMANEITLKSANISDAVYETPWYTYDIKTRKALMLMQMRCRRPSCLKASMFDINLDTMIRIFRATYSSYTVLRQMNN